MGKAHPPDSRGRDLIREVFNRRGALRPDVRIDAQRMLHGYVILAAVAMPSPRALPRAGVRASPPRRDRPARQ